MTIKSASEQIHAVLAREARGFKFVASQLQQICKIAGHDVTEGAVTGFIFRAKQKGMISQEAKRRGVGRGRSHMAVVYVLNDPKIAWDFAGPSEGRQTGSLNLGTKPTNQQEFLLEDAGTSLGDILGATLARHDAEPKDKHWLGEMGETTEILEHITLNVPSGGLADRLLALAAEVGDLEDRPVKTLADYTNDELIAELKSRLHA